MDFNQPITYEDGLGDEETTPLDVEAATLDDKGYEATMHEDSYNDEGHDA